MKPLSRAELSDDKVRAIGEKIGIDWKKSKFPVEQLREGILVEYEHSDVTHGDLETTARIARTHLDEMADYYTRLKKMEKGSAAMLQPTPQRPPPVDTTKSTMGRDYTPPAADFSPQAPADMNTQRSFGGAATIPGEKTAIYLKVAYIIGQINAAIDRGVPEELDKISAAIKAQPGMVENMFKWFGKKAPETTKRVRGALQPTQATAGLRARRGH